MVNMSTSNEANSVTKVLEWEGFICSALALKGGSIPLFAG
jgi:hypothetical protein